MLIHIFLILMILIISIAAYVNRSLNLPGSVVSFFLGATLYISGGVTFLAPLFAFFVSSSLLTMYRKREKKKMEAVLYEKTGTRDHVQVLANGGAAFIMAAMHIVHPGEASAAALFVAFAACNADTWASEIGVLSKRAPVSILTFKPVPNGISGGVTLPGTIGALGGAFLIAVFYMGTGIWNTGLWNLAGDALVIMALGFAGSLLDSLLGASVQPLYRNAETGMLTEKRRQGQIPNIKVKGFGFFSNDMINFLSSAAAAFMFFLIKSAC